MAADTHSPMTVAVAGALAAKAANGGEAWVRMSWVEAFLRLGYAVLFVEEVHEAEPKACEWFTSVTTLFGLADSSWLVDGTGRVLIGPHAFDLPDRLDEANVLINISGNLRCRDLLKRPSLRVYLDLDPGYTQLWHENGVGDLQLEAHDAHLTVGEQIGDERCTIPTGGFHWIPTSQPVVMDRWPPIDPTGDTRFTTVTTWRDPYGPVELNGDVFRGKHQEFRRFAGLPARIAQRFEIATRFHEADDEDRVMLTREGWGIVSTAEATGSMTRFQRFIQGSWAEFSVAQGVYVETNSAWFSDRSTRYLASGRPVLIQDTGWTRRNSVSEGIVTFRSVEEAVSGAHAIASSYAMHAQAARALAETHFDSNVVAGKVLARLQLGSR